MPDLEFVVVGAEVARYSVSPLMLFKLRVVSMHASEEIASVALQCQIQIETAKRGYSASEKEQLEGLFGEPQRWAQTLRTMLWTHTSATVPAFTGQCEIDLAVPCTFDFNVAATKYFGSLSEAAVPLMLQFSGTIFYRDADDALQVARVPWHKEAAFRLPVATWRAMMDHYYPNGAWLCIQRDVFDRLERYRIGHALVGWEQVFTLLLDSACAVESVARDQEGRL